MAAEHDAIECFAGRLRLNGLLQPERRMLRSPVLDARSGAPTLAQVHRVLTTMPSETVPERRDQVKT
jgi:hypothetical protein